MNTNGESEKQPRESDWMGSYGQSWGDLIVPDSFAHPAKFSRKLIFRIFDHLIEERWLKPGDTCLDCFGGVALAALPAMKHGLNWIGVELEQKFVDLGCQNIALWNDRYAGKLPHWGQAVLLQGDSRELVRVIREAGGLVSSPPYAGGLGKVSTYRDRDKLEKEIQRALVVKKAAGSYYGVTPGQLGNLPAGDVDGVVASPPCDDPDKRGGLFHDEKRKTDKTLTATYGDTDGQLASMPPGRCDAVLSSPPFLSQVACQDPNYATGRTTPGGPLYGDYGTTEGQLATLPPGEQPSAAVSSPPFLDNNVNIGAVGDTPAMRQQIHDSKPRPQSYGADPAQLGNQPRETFWSAAHTIVSQTYQVLAPGSHAIWITKRYVRDKKIVEFSQQWAQLCQSVGFELVHWHRAWLVEDKGAQYTLDGGLERKTVKRYSFFRRLHSAKYPELEIAWEDVLCTVKR